MNSGSLVGSQGTTQGSQYGRCGRSIPVRLLACPDEGSASYLDIKVRALPGLEAHAGAELGIGNIDARAEGAAA